MPGCDERLARGRKPHRVEAVPADPVGDRPVVIDCDETVVGAEESLSGDRVGDDRMNVTEGGHLGFHAFGFLRCAGGQEQGDARGRGDSEGETRKHVRCLSVAMCGGRCGVIRLR